MHVYRSRLLAMLCKDERSTKLPIYNMLQKIYLERVVRAPEIELFQKVRYILLFIHVRTRVLACLPTYTHKRVSSICVFVRCVLRPCIRACLRTHVHVHTNNVCVRARSR